MRQNSADRLVEQLADLDEQLVAEAQRCYTWPGAAPLHALAHADGTAALAVGE